MNNPVLSRITVCQNQMGGVPCIRGLRIPVATMVAMIADGMNTDEILKAYPDLQEEDILAALDYKASLQPPAAASGC